MGVARGLVKVAEGVARAVAVEERPSRHINNPAFRRDVPREPGSRISVGAQASVDRHEDVWRDPDEVGNQDHDPQRRPDMQPFGTEARPAPWNWNRVKEPG